MLDILNHMVALEPDIIVVGTTDQADLSHAVRRLRADVLIVGQDAQSERDLLSVLFRRPQLKLLTVARDGRSGWSYELRPRRIQIRKLSRRSLTDAIRPRALATSEPGRRPIKPKGFHR
jgi:hypothetical protein